MVTHKLGNFIEINAMDLEPTHGLEQVMHMSESGLKITCQVLGGKLLFICRNTMFLMVFSSWIKLMDVVIRNI